MEITETGLQIPSPQPVNIRDALLALTAVNHDIVLFNYGNVVVRRDYDSFSTVKFISGGVGGSDLSHAIFVGKGMLTAAVLGDEAAPSSRLILHTIKEISRGVNCGVFVIAQTNSDLFNFGLAVERANKDCRMRVKLLPVNDIKSAQTGRSSCGFILLTKLLGAMAERGVMYDEIFKCFNNLNEHIITLPLNYVDDEAIGSSRRKSLRITTDFTTDVRDVIHAKSDFNLDLHPSIPTVILINTSTSLERMEQLGLVKQVIEGLKRVGVCILRVYYDSFVTAMPGNATLTLLKVHDLKLIELLDDPCRAPGWQRVSQFLPEISTNNEVPGLLTKNGREEIELKGPKLGQVEVGVLRKCLQFACDALISCERQLNTIDSESSVGNVGTRMKKLAEIINKRVGDNKLALECPFALLKKLSVLAESSLGGTMGSIYGVLFDSAANMFGELPQDEEITALTWAQALTVATNTAKTFVSPEMQRVTLWYAIKSCEVGVNRELDREQNYLQSFGVGVAWAEEGAQRTRRPPCRHPDAGAHAVGIWMRALFEGVKLMGGNGTGCD